ncbi:Ig-like domain-containing protein [Candidatus Accumulibacter vicinus]|uniref:Chitodextrinase n=1 Tax=Candidatus Accumulibacter vicinus TaxID=2954382 RepID=A0A084XYQ6_9PROT|nr:Ig-like domain-containing protein [Candidatus Accumulibacter vicinus]KFB67600.1 MAG: Chitodextrinase precursor [Candidatus Accumulibacter vicinus]
MGNMNYGLIVSSWRMPCRLMVFWLMLLALCANVAATETIPESPDYPNIVLTTDDFNNQRLGAFEEFRGYLARSSWALTSVGPGKSSFTFQPQIPRRGWYTVYLWWPITKVNAKQAQILVQHAEGSSTARADQTMGGGLWQRIGTFPFTPESSSKIELVGNSDKPVVVDALRLQFVGESRPGLRIVTSALPIAVVNERFDAFLEVDGGRPPVKCHVPLPSGLALDAARLAISGTPTVPGQWDITVSCFDSSGVHQQRVLSLEILSNDQERSRATPVLYSPGASNSEINAAAAPTTSEMASGQALTELQAMIASLPEGNWAKVNTNNYSDVWTPPDLRPVGAYYPSAIIGAWSSFGWDTNRADLWLYGGGHANYSGNDVYRWRASTMMWERASLPSQVIQDPLGNYIAVDGPDAAPASAHTYDNNIFLPIVDRLLVLGGAAWQNGGQYRRQATATTSRNTGPYFFDPNRADPGKVGGSTGSHVQNTAPHPEVVGGEMWQNRDHTVNLASAPLPASHVNGCTAYAAENGRDTVYVGATSGGTARNLYRYVINDVTAPAADNWERIGGYWGSPTDSTSCAFDPGQKLFVLTGNNSFPLYYWNTATPGSKNYEVRINLSDPNGQLLPLLQANAITLKKCGLDFDPVQRKYMLWCGDGRVWSISPPETISASGWSVSLQPTPTGSVPNGDTGTGILGKWKYASDLGVFIGLQDRTLGNVWVYKPVSGTNQSPVVNLTAPPNGATIAAGGSVTLIANASDIDGTVSKVEFFAGAEKLSEITSPPYQFFWVNPPAGSHILTARATDNLGKTAVSPPITITMLGINQPPVVSLSSPANGTTINTGTFISINANASDSDGSIARVEFFEGSKKIGESLSPPFSVAWSASVVGSYTLSAIAYDNLGASTASAPISVTVITPLPESTLSLQDGVNGYAGTRDTYLSVYSKTTSLGTQTYFLSGGSSYTSLVRFAIFASEGGPIPDGATIQSATLSMYKSTAYDYTYRAHRILMDWSETQATWQQRLAGAAWSAAGANNSGSDYLSIADGQGSVGWNSGWLNIDVSVGVQQMAQGQPNFGWRLIEVSGNNNLKRFYTRESASNPNLRPKLTILYRSAQ